MSDDLSPKGLPDQRPYSLVEDEPPGLRPVAWVRWNEMAITYQQISMSEIWPQTGGAR